MNEMERKAAPNERDPHHNSRIGTLSVCSFPLSMSWTPNTILLHQLAECLRVLGSRDHVAGLILGGAKFLAADGLRFCATRC